MRGPPGLTPHSHTTRGLVLGQCIHCIGAALLDLHDPTKVIGRLSEPLLAPEGNEREGYVPNVVYSCGSLLHGRQLILPYAMSDKASAIASLSLDELLVALKSGIATPDVVIPAPL